jgi:DNA-binding response OmpR family regulator
MKVLIADDSTVSLRLLEAVFTKWGHETILARDGNEAWALLQEGDIRMAIIDWMMPDLNGLELCQRIRAQEDDRYTYLILITGKTGSQDLFDGLAAGADDYIVKPFDPRTLEARVKVGLRTLELEDRLARRITDLEDAITKIQTLEGLLPVCSYCHKIRNDDNYWQKVDSYMSERTNLKVSHGICPDCFKEHVQPDIDDLRKTHKE